MTKSVTAQTYTQLRLININCLTTPKILTAKVGKNTDNRQTPMIKSRLGITIPLLNVDFDKITLLIFVYNTVFILRPVLI